MPQPWRPRWRPDDDEHRRDCFQCHSRIDVDIMKCAWVEALGTCVEAYTAAFHTSPVVVVDNNQDAPDSPFVVENHDVKKIRGAREPHMGAGNIVGRAVDR